MNRPPALVFGVPIADVTMDETLESIGQLVRIGRRDGRTFQVTTPNVDFLVNAEHHPDVHDILRRADLCIADGAPVVWASRLLGMPIRERVAGSDLVPRLIQRAATTGWKIHVFGSSPDVAARSTELLHQRYPGARFSIDPGPMIPDPTAVGDDVLESIAAVDADVLCVALGNPKQERFIRANRERLRVPVMIGVGGSLDMLAGERRRAPELMQRFGLEWVFRAIQEPRRLGPRYAHDIRIFTPRLTRELRAARRRRNAGGLSITSQAATVIARMGRFDDPELAEFEQAVRLLDAGADLRFESIDDHAMSDRAASYLIGLLQQARRRGSSVSWPDTGVALESAFRDLSIDPAALALS